MSFTNIKQFAEEVRTRSTLNEAGILTILDREVYSVGQVFGVTWKEIYKHILTKDRRIPKSNGMYHVDLTDKECDELLAANPPKVEVKSIKIPVASGSLYITVLKLDGVEYYATNTGNQNGWVLCPKITNK